MLKILLATTALTACATTGFDRDAASHRRRSFEITSEAQTRGAFPTAIDPQLPSVDRIARIVETRLGDRANARIELCVSSDGRVEHVTLVEGSTYPAFDVALIRDIRDWEFTALPDHALRACKRATVSYRLP